MRMADLTPLFGLIVPLMGAAAILLRHEYEETTASERAEQLLGQMKRAG